MLIDTNNSIFTTDFENIVSAFLTVIIYTNKQVAEKCNSSLTAKL